MDRIQATDSPAAKLSVRQVGPFPIIEVIGELAYKLQLPDKWNIHPVISIAHLEKHIDDTYQRELPPPPDLAEEDGEHFQYEVESIVAKRYNKRRKRHEWLVKWKNWGIEHNTWHPREDLENCQELVQEFEDTQTEVFHFRLDSQHIPQTSSNSEIPRNSLAFMYSYQSHLVYHIRTLYEFIFRSWGVS